MSAIVVLEVGASAKGQASCNMGVMSVTSQARASFDFELAVIPISLAPIF